MRKNALSTPLLRGYSTSVAADISEAGNSVYEIINSRDEQWLILSYTVGSDGVDKITPGKLCRIIVYSVEMNSGILFTVS